MASLHLGLLLLAIPVDSLLFRRSSLVDHASQAASSSSSSTAAANPLLSLYRKWTFQYEKDADEALGEAKFYADETQKLADKVTAKGEGIKVRKKLTDMGVSDWAYAAWTVQGMLNDPAPVKAGAAAAKAAAPYNAAYAAYDTAKVQYDTAAQGYALRAKMDAGLAHQLMSYSNQFRLQGNNQRADEYKGQSTGLMTQANTFKGLANQYSEQAAKIYGVLPSIQNWAGKAAGYAAFEENPLGALPAKEIFPFTVVPPAP
jgi:hypothetical protein